MSDGVTPAAPGPEVTSIVVPAFNEAASIASVVRDLRSAAPWLEIIVVDDGSTDETGARAAAAGARVARHPYNKGNGAAVKTGIRQAQGRYVDRGRTSAALCHASGSRSAGLECRLLHRRAHLRRGAGLLRAHFSALLRLSGAHIPA